MKRLLLIVLPLLLIVGCSKSVREYELIEKDGLKFHPETKELYTGKVHWDISNSNNILEGFYNCLKE